MSTAKPSSRRPSRPPSGPEGRRGGSRSRRSRLSLGPLLGALAIAAVLSVLASACTDTPDDPDQPAPDEQPAATSDDPGAASADDGEDTADSGAEGSSAPPQQPDEPPRAPFPLAEIELTTPGGAGGVRPELGWEPVGGAATYSVTVYAASGDAWWAWHGSETSVVVGRGDQVDTVDDVADGGPVVRAGMSWDVVAFDADGTPIAHSPVRPLTP